MSSVKTALSPQHRSPPPPPLPSTFQQQSGESLPQTLPLHGSGKKKQKKQKKQQRPEQPPSDRLSTSSVTAPTREELAEQLVRDGKLVHRSSLNKINLKKPGNYNTAP